MSAKTSVVVSTI